MFAKLLKFTVFVAVVLFFVWLLLVCLYSPALSENIRLIYAAALSINFFALYSRSKLFLTTFILICILPAYRWSSLQPSNQRIWQKDLQILASADINQNIITVKNIRDLNYRSETDYDLRYQSKTVNLEDLTSVDIFASHWSIPDIAHIFISFGFAEKDFIAISIEARKTILQAYSTIDGFFRNYELIYVVAEERDLVQLRTKFRKPNEQVYLYRLAFYKPYAQKLFLQYMNRINTIQSKPEFYNSLTTNCTTQVLNNVQLSGGQIQGVPVSKIRDRFNYDWRVLVSGHLPDYLYRKGNLSKDLSIDDLRSISLINTKSLGDYAAAEFSAKIREGLPKPALFSNPPL